MADPLLRVENLVRRFGGIVATDNVSLDVARGELHAVIGPNGAGKTTLISQLIGQLLPHSGTIRLAGQDITRVPAYRRSALGLARSFQITSLLLDFTAIDNVALAAQAHDGHSFYFWSNARKEDHLRRTALSALDRVGLRHRADVLVSRLSHGEQRELELARTRCRARHQAAIAAAGRADGRTWFNGVGAYGEAAAGIAAGSHHCACRA